MKYVEFEAQIFNYKVTLLIKSTSTLNFSSIGLIIKKLVRLRIRTCALQKRDLLSFIFILYYSGQTLYVHIKSLLFSIVVLFSSSMLIFNMEIPSNWDTMMFTKRTV